MKLLKFQIAIFLAVIVFSSFGQDQRILYKVNKNSFYVDKESLDIAFVNCFNSAVESGQTKYSDRNDWVETYKTYINQAITGTYELEILGSMLVGSAYLGYASAENLGNDPSGKNKNSIIPRKIKAPYERMLVIQTTLSKEVMSQYNSKR